MGWKVQQRPVGQNRHALLSLWPYSLLYWASKRSPSDRKIDPKLIPPKRPKNRPKGCPRGRKVGLAGFSWEWGGAVVLPGRFCRVPNVQVGFHRHIGAKCACVRAHVVTTPRGMQEPATGWTEGTSGHYSATRTRSAAAGRPRDKPWRPATAAR